MTTTHQGQDSAESRAPYERIEGIHVLRVSGTDYEMGFQHGQILKDAILRGPLPYFTRYVEKLLAHGLLGDRAGPASRAFGAVLAATVGKRIGAKFPKHAREALEGLADGAGMSRKAVMDAVTMPETYLWVGTWYKRLLRAPLAARHGVPVLGCTSAIAWGDATPHGRMLHGRNFDYQGVGAWDREQAVVFHNPTGGRPYVSITAAGVLLGGITAMNAAGLTLVVHQHIASADFDLDGLPVGIAGDLVMRHATSIDDAKRILDGHRPNGAWTYVITSAREKKVLVYEVTAHRRATFRPDRGVFGYSNVFMDRELERTEVDFYPSYWRNNVARWHRANAGLDRGLGALDADAIAGILGDVGDGCRLTTNISSLTTVASVVFDAERGLVYVATGRPPLSNRPYLAFDLSRQQARPELPRLLGGTKIDPRALEAFDAYREAYERHFNDEDLAAARGLVARARELAPEQSVYAFVAGLLALEAKDLQGAKDAFDAAIGLGHAVAQRLAGFYLWRGRTQDAMWRRDDARLDYREAACSGDPAVRKAGARGLAHAWRLRAPAIEWSFGDVIAP